MLTIFEWRGTYEGCYCGTTISLGPDCGSCDIISPSMPLQLKNWQGKNLCVSRIKGQWATKQDCPPLTRRCNQYVCVNLDEDCPIDKIILINNPTATTPLDPSITYDELVPLTATTSFAVTRMKDVATAGNGFFTFSVTLQKPPCINPRLDSPILKDFYPLYQSTFSCGDYGIDTDGSVKIMDGNLPDFLKLNQLTGIIGALRDFNQKYAARTVTLYARNYIPYFSS